jgi:hypothetical protein
MLIIPILIILSILLHSGEAETVTKTVNVYVPLESIEFLSQAPEAGTNSVDVNAPRETVRTVTHKSGGLIASLFIATALMIIFRQRYPRWWFDFARELTRFATRVGAYLFLLTEQYPSTVDGQSVHLEIDYPDVEKELDRYQPLFKWLLAIPHYIVLFFLGIGALFAVIVAWFIILGTGRYPRELFEFVVGVMRWGLRVDAYAFLLVTDRYPPFSLK